MLDDEISEHRLLDTDTRLYLSKSKLIRVYITAADVIHS